jgi:hypothetical protein
LPKIDFDFRFLRVPVRDLNKRFADVETGDMVAAEFGQFDGEISRSRRDFENTAIEPSMPMPL